MKIRELKNNTGQIPNIPKNPRFIKNERFDKLVKSIKEFPKMLELRPIVYVVYENQNIVIGGNMRLKALIELGFKDIPNEYLKEATHLSDEEKKRFVIADNVAFGNDDFDLLANEWEIQDLESWGQNLPISNDEKTSTKPKDFIDEFNEIKNGDCEMPIVPEFLEKHECFIIPIDNEIDENFIRNIFGLNENFQSRDGKIRKSNVIKIENVRKSFHSDTN